MQHSADNTLTARESSTLITGKWGFLAQTVGFQDLQANKEQNSSWKFVDHLFL